MSAKRGARALVRAVLRNQLDIRRLVELFRTCGKTSPNGGPAERFGHSKISKGAAIRELVVRLRPDMKTAAVAALLTLGLLWERLGEDRQIADQTNLSPISLVFPAPSFHSGPRRIENNPHAEPYPQWPRPPFLAPVGSTNLALHKRVTSSDTNCSSRALAMITDGYKEEDETRMVALRSGKQWVQIDLGELSSVYAVVLWHREDRDRVFYCVAVQTANDSNFTDSVHTLFNNDYANLLGLKRGDDKLYYETFSGKLVDAEGVKGRYVRCYSRGNNEERLNWYREVEVWGLPLK